VQENPFTHTGQFRAKMVGRSLRDRRREVDFFMWRFVLVMRLMPFGHGAF